MYRDIVFWMILLIMGAMLLTNGINTDDYGWELGYNYLIWEVS